jgi:hypothetical protein
LFIVCDSSADRRLGMKISVSDPLPDYVIRLDG